MVRKAVKSKGKKKAPVHIEVENADPEPEHPEPEPELPKGGEAMQMFSDGESGSEAGEAPGSDEESGDSASEADLEEPSADEEEAYSGSEENDEETVNKHKEQAEVTSLDSLKQKIEDDISLLNNWRQADAVMRQGRSREEVNDSIIDGLSAMYGYSRELAEYFYRMFSPEEAVQFFESNEKPRPVTIRTNTIKTRRRLLAQSLVTRGMAVDPVGEWTKIGLKIYDSQVPVGATPEYLSGRYMIQSASSFVPVMALAAQPNELVLDMAAAPGGKTTHIGQAMQNTGVLFANDLKKDRCKSLAANCQRLGLTNTVITCYDGLELPKVIPRLDRCLLDAPCTGSGIIARDPSIKAKRTVADFRDQSQLQKKLLCAAVDMVNAKSKTGGIIVYSTCSSAVEENEDVIHYILKARNVKIVPMDEFVNIGRPGFKSFRQRRYHPSMANTRRFYPHAHNMDGFFVCKLQKFSNDIPQKINRDRRQPTEVVWGEEQWVDENLELGHGGSGEEDGAPPEKRARTEPSANGSAPSQPKSNGKEGEGKASGKKVKSKVKGGAPEQENGQGEEKSEKPAAVEKKQKKKASEPTAAADAAPGKPLKKSALSAVKSKKGAVKKKGKK
mmetsp:Transcript_2619/g.6149  ORF Transcript_2619/g.6149 Transcript_2619/m.6149 type:complete len:614 (-) Transcript_2619:104-1945(-)